MVIILSHQYFKLLDSVSLNLKHSTLANTSNKFVGKVDMADARAMGERIRIEPEQILNLKKKDRDFTEYYCHIKDRTQKAIKLRVPLGAVNQKERMSDESYNLLIKQNRQKYCVKKDEPDQKQQVGQIEPEEGFKVGERKEL